MARMIPSTIHSTIQSGAERRLFKLLADTPGTENWVVLHSLGLARHETKRRGEIDFLILCPLGVFVLEVKGGRVRREAGEWIFTDRYGRQHRKAEGPFEQAAGAMFALERALADAGLAFVGELLLGYGVALPDIQFDGIGAEHPDLVYDRRHRERSFAAYITRLASFHQERSRRLRRGPSGSEIEKLVDCLRGDFDLVPSLAVVAEDTRTQLTDLTRAQRTVLDALTEHPRVLIDGPAGTGKTLLAIETARRAARDGRTVLYLCFNKLLAARGRAVAALERCRGTVIVRNVHSLFFSMIEASSLAGEYAETIRDKSDEEIFGTLMPKYAALAALEDVVAPTDVLIIDEGQDLVSAAHVDVFDLLVRDGIKNGRWALFMDMNNQASVYGVAELETLARLRSAGREWPLSINCRNTKQIAVETELVAAPKRAATAQVDGVPVDFVFYERQRGWLGKLERALADLRHEGLAPGRISILVATIPSDKDVKALEKLGVQRLNENDVPLLGTDQLVHPTWSPVSGFKGLENDVVILAGIENIDAEWWKAIAYVGMSRARTALTVLLESGCEPVRRQRLEAEMKRRIEEGDMLA